MSFKRNYIDRSPNIRPAGKLVNSDEAVGDILKMYPSEEAAFNIINSMCKNPNQTMQNTGDLAFGKFLLNESVKDLLCPELKKSRFIAFREKFSEDMFFKKPDLGQALSLSSKPSEFTNDNFTYGFKNKTSESVYELICPNKSPQQVKEEFLKWHDKYLISHKSYLPSERIKRNYDKNFNPHALFGVCNNVDKTGQLVMKCLQQSNRIMVINKVQKKYLDRTNGQLGEKIDRSNPDLDTHKAFGLKPQQPSNCNVRSLIENIEPCEQNNKTVEALSYIHKLRRFLFNRRDFHMYDLKAVLKNNDESGTGFIAFKTIVKALRLLKIQVNEQRLLEAISHFELFEDNKSAERCVNIEELWKILNIQYPLKRKTFISVFPKNNENELTTYSIMCSDLNNYTVSQRHMARKLKKNERTTAGDLVAPDIPINYGLTASDFKILRSKDDLKRIFKRLSPQYFDRIWLFALSERGCVSACKMSVIEFRAVMDEYNKQNFK